jgi:hypothetical protein
MLDGQANYALLRAFIQEASARSIVAGVQATLLLDLAAELCKDDSGNGRHCEWFVHISDLIRRASDAAVHPCVGIAASVPTAGHGVFHSKTTLSCLVSWHLHADTMHLLQRCLEFAGAAVVASDAVQLAKAECGAAASVPASSPVPELQPASAMAADAATAANPQLMQPQQQQQQHSSALIMPSIGATSSSSEATGLSMLPHQPLLHIAPLDLNLNSTAAPGAASSYGITSSSPSQDAAAAAAVAAAAAAASALDQPAAGLLGLGSFAHNASSSMGLPPALLAAATQAQQQQPSTASVDMVVEAAAAAAYAQHQHAYSGHLDTSGMYAADATLAAAAAAAAQLDSSAAAAQLQGAATLSASQQQARSARKQRFTREQQQAILESVERFYAACPSRYTELVIKHMQERFPGIEISNACVRKIKFRWVR